MMVKEESEKAGLKLHLKKLDHGSVLNTSWQTEGEKVETMKDFLFWAPVSLQTVTATMKFKDACSLKEML